MTPYLTHRIFRINSTLSKVSRQQLGVSYMSTHFVKFCLIYCGYQSNKMLRKQLKWLFLKKILIKQLRKWCFILYKSAILCVSNNRNQLSNAKQKQILHEILYFANMSQNLSALFLKKHSQWFLFRLHTNITKRKILSFYSFRIIFKSEETLFCICLTMLH